MAGNVALTSRRTEGVIRRDVITCTADAADGSFPATTLRSLGVFIDGIILSVATNPGTPAPTDNWDLTLVDGDGLDRLDGMCLNRDTSTSERQNIMRAAALDETLTLTLAGNATNSAVVAVIITHAAVAPRGDRFSFTGADLAVVDSSSLAQLQALAAAVVETDTASTGADDGLRVMAIRDDVLTTLTPADGDWTSLRVSSTGALQVKIDSGSVTASGDVSVSGNVAHDAVDSGNPVKIGGKASTAAPAAVANGDRVDAFFAATGALEIGGYGRNLSDAASVEVLPWVHDSANIGPFVVSNRIYNGASLDMQRANVEATLLASAARTATTNSADQTNHNGRGVHVSIDVTVEGPATLAIKIQGKHSVGGTYYDIADFGTVYTAASDAPGVKTVSLYPGNIAADHVGVGAGVNGTIAKSGVLPRTWRAVVTHADATTCTYSLSAVTIL